MRYESGARVQTGLGVAVLVTLGAAGYALWPVIKPVRLLIPILRGILRPGPQRQQIPNLRYVFSLNTSFIVALLLGSDNPLESLNCPG